MVKTRDQVESELRSSFDDYWSMFFMSGETDSTSHEWARSQMIEVSEALFWTAFEKPKKIFSVDRFVLREWMDRIRAGRAYYESKEDLLLMLSFGSRWSPDRICRALKISKSAYYFRLFQAMRQRSSLFKQSSGHLSAACAHYDLRLPEYLVNKNLNLPMEASFVRSVESHVQGCPRCESLQGFASELVEVVHSTWNKPAPTSVIEESLNPFVDAKTNLIKRNLWARMPPWLRTTVALAVVVALAYWAFKASPL